MPTDKFTLDPAVRLLLADMGISAPDVLRRAELPGDLLTRRPARLSAAEFARFWEALSAVSPQPDLPIRIAEALTAEVFSPPLFSGLLSDDLNAAARRIARYKPLVGPATIDVVVGSSATTIEYHWPGDWAPPPDLGLTEVLFWLALARIATRKPIEASRLTAPEPPARLEAYVAYAGVPVRKEPYYSISFTAPDAREPFLTSSESLWSSFEPELKRRLSELEANATTSDRVRAALIELIPAGHPTMGAVAERLALSTRTLHRRLDADGTTFQAVLNDTRESLARHYLANPSLSANEIAYLLGYEEPSSFYRAFHTWTGQTPRSARAALT